MWRPGRRRDPVPGTPPRKAVSTRWTSQWKLSFLSPPGTEAADTKKTSRPRRRFKHLSDGVLEKTGSGTPSLQRGQRTRRTRTGTALLQVQTEGTAENKATVRRNVRSSPRRTRSNILKTFKNLVRTSTEGEAKESASFGERKTATVPASSRQILPPDSILIVAA